MDLITEKQEAVQDAIDAINKDKIQSEIDDLNDQIDSITENLEEEFKKFDDIINKWESIQSDKEFETNSNLVDQILGEGWEDKVLNGTDEEIYEYIKNQFNQNSDLLNKYDQQIENVDQVQALVQYYIEQYKKGNITQQEAMTHVKELLNGITGEITSGENVMNIINALATSNKSEATANGLLDNIKGQLENTSNDMVEAFKLYEKNSNTIVDYMDDIIDAIEDGFDDLDDYIDNIKDRYDDDDKDHGGGGSSGGKDYGDSSNSPPHDDDQDPDHGPGVARAAMFMADNVVDAIDESNKNSLAARGLRELNNDEINSMFYKNSSPNLQNKLVDSLSTAFSTMLPNLMMQTKLPNFKPIETATNIDINMGDINLPDVRDVDGFAKAMGTRFSSLMKQELGKR